jgi:hypothetical protein
MELLRRVLTSLAIEAWKRSGVNQAKRMVGRTSADMPQILRAQRKVDSFEHMMRMKSYLVGVVSSVFC